MGDSGVVVTVGTISAARLGRTDRGGVMGRVRMVAALACVVIVATVAMGSFAFERGIGARRGCCGVGVRAGASAIFGSC
jgi:hypothetical protein